MSTLPTCGKKGNMKNMQDAARNKRLLYNGPEQEEMEPPTKINVLISITHETNLGRYIL